MGNRVAARQNQLVDTHFLGQLIERFALHELRAGVGQKAFTFARKMTIDDIANRSVEYCIA